MHHFQRKRLHTSISDCLTRAIGIVLGSFAGVVVAATAPLAWENGAGHRSAPVVPAGTGKTGFTSLDGAQTGVRFTNVLSIDSASKNHNLMQGAGVAAGDFDNDGWCDLYFCNVEGRNALYRNLGGIRFADVTEQAGVLAPRGMFSTGAAFADVNGDGALDLVVSANNGVALFVNLGDGTFTNTTAAAGLNTRPLGSTSIALADLDGNGALDLFIANYGENTILRSGGQVSFRYVNGKPVVSGRHARRLKIIDGRLVEFGEPSALYLNDGKGKFTELSWTDGRFLDEESKPLKEAPNDLSLSVMMRDINGDGAPDIYVCNDFQTPDRIWINDGQARFRALPRLAVRQVSNFSMGVDFADFDRDGHDDFIVVDMLSRLHTLKMTQMIETNLVTSMPGQIDNRPQIRRNVMFWNRGDGTYAEIANFAGVAATDWTWTPLFLDVDLDGYEDLLVSNGHAFDTQDLDVTMAPSMGQGPEAARKHLVSFPKLETPNYAFRNRRDRTFEEVGAQWGFDSKQVCHGVITADFDNDGDLDVAVSSLNAPALIYRNESAAPRLAVRLKGKAPNGRGIGARVTVLGGVVPEQAQEIICGGRYLSADDTVRMFAAGAMTNEMTIRVRWRSGLVSEVTGARANRIYEIDEAAARAVQSPKPEVQSPKLFVDASALFGHKHHEEAFDDFARQPLLSRKLSQLGPGVAWIDLDDDGRDECVVGTGRGGALTILKATGSGFSSTAVPGIATDDLLGLTAFAVDGKRSLLVARANYETGGASALLNLSLVNGAPVVTTQATMNAVSLAAVAAADIDGDGALEVFAGARVVPGSFPQSGASQILRLANGKLAPDAEKSRGLEDAGMVSSATWSDLDGDGFPELLLACDWGALKIFRNARGMLAAWNAPVTGAGAVASALDELTGWWTGVATGDFDGDGRFDIVAGNWGLNSEYHATPEQPLRLYFGDFNGDGGLRLLEAEFDHGLKRVVPRENLTLLGPAMPFLRARFPTYASFRTATPAEVLGERMSLAKEWRAATLASVLLLNRGEHFEWLPLPQEAQWAPILGISVADADGDGADDIFLAQNFFATRKEIPRLDAGRGLWLRNDGKGRFTAMRGSDSGVVVWGEGRGCATSDIDGDGKVDLVVTQNGAETKLFRNQNARPGLRVRLRGLAGNPEAIGAVARVKYADGEGPAHEIRGASTVLGLRATPVKVAVRWPGGKVSEAAVLAGAKEITIENPK
jgi:enediyne biosynthesis protein E4